MMNFDYLHGINELSDLYQACRNAELYVYSDAQTSVMHARIAGEIVTKILYTHFYGSIPISANGVQVSTAQMENQVRAKTMQNPLLTSNMISVRLVGNTAAHSGHTQNFDTNTSLTVLNALHCITGEACKLVGYISEYAPFQTPQQVETSAPPFPEQRQVDKVTGGKPSAQTLENEKNLYTGSAFATPRANASIPHRSSNSTPNNTDSIPAALRKRRTGTERSTTDQTPLQDADFSYSTPPVQGSLDVPSRDSYSNCKTNDSISVNAGYVLEEPHTNIPTPLLPIGNVQGRLEPDGAPCEQHIEQRSSEKNNTSVAEGDRRTVMPDVPAYLARRRRNGDSQIIDELPRNTREMPDGRYVETELDATQRDNTEADAYDEIDDERLFKELFVDVNGWRSRLRYSVEKRISGMANGISKIIQRNTNKVIEPPRYMGDKYRILYMANGYTLHPSSLDICKALLTSDFCDNYIVFIGQTVCFTLPEMDTFDEVFNLALIHVKELYEYRDQVFISDDGDWGTEETTGSTRYAIWHTMGLVIFHPENSIPMTYPMCKNEEGLTIWEGLINKALREIKRAGVSAIIQIE